MKYCGHYSNKIKMNMFDEIAIIYNGQDRELPSFLQDHQKQRIILIVQDIDDFSKNEEWKKLNAIKHDYPKTNFAVCFGQVKKFEEASNDLKLSTDNLKVPFFTGDLVVNFDQLHYICGLGVTEVYLGEDICFDLGRAKAVCRGYGVQIRAFPNVGQCSIKSGPALKKFFIRPEDVEQYEDVISTLEFWGPLNRQEVLYKIYTRGSWPGDLNDLILDFNLSLDSNRILPIFATMRKNCSRKCMKGESCNICDQILSISHQMANKKLVIKTKKHR